MTQLEKFLSVIEKLPHSQGRVPFTYHQDHLIAHTNRFQFSSRSEVAANHKESAEELYAIALIEILEGMHATAFIYIDPSDVLIIRKAYSTTRNVLLRYADNP